MWWSVLFILFVVGNGLGVSGNNQDVFEKLCRIAGNVSALMGKDNGVKSRLKEALYGENGKGHFSDDGRFTGHCGLSMHSRSQYCSHIQGAHLGLGGSDNHGCFGHSLLGTFLCLCTVGGTEQQDLCGLGNVGGGKRWTGGIYSGGHEQELFKELWKQIKEKCIKFQGSTVNGSAELVNLENALNGIKEESRKKIATNGYFTLGGGNKDGICSGTNVEHACVTYTVSGNAPQIPWADKILTAITTFKEAIQRQTSSLTSATQTSLDHLEDPSDPEPGYEQEGEEEEYREPAENHDPKNLTKPPRTKRKRRNTNKQPTEQHPEPRRVILYKDDGSFLPQPFWLLSVVLFF